MKKNRASLQMRRALAALTVNCLPTLDLADRRAEAAAREANILMVAYERIVALVTW